MIQLTEKPIDTEKLLAQACQPEAGAVVLFLGITRQFTGGRETVDLQYSAYRQMAEKQLRLLEAEARERWSLAECLIVHRLGNVALSEASVAIVVASPHRGEAFAAGQWLIDTLKQRVPIWKQEHWKDGATEWVHPEKSLASRLSTPDSHPPLTDRLGRVHTSLRISVTDRCNIRCFYCMPATDVVFRPREELLSFEEIQRMAHVAASLGVNKLRITGGEPLMRSELPTLIRQLTKVPGIVDLALTTNAMLLADQAAELKGAGLDRLNISLDAMNEQTFQKIARRKGPLAGIAAARRVGFKNIRLNTVSMRGLTEAEILPLAHFARQHELQLRFIEFMPLDSDGAWSNTKMLLGQEVRDLLEAEFGPLEAAPRRDPSQPAVDYRFADGRGSVGFINSVSEPFCKTCNRLRLTSDGQLYNCLFSSENWDAKALLRGGAKDNDLRQLFRDCIAAKQPAHGIGQVDFQSPERAMYQIGG